MPQVSILRPGIHLPLHSWIQAGHTKGTVSVISGQLQIPDCLGSGLVGDLKTWEFGVPGKLCDISDDTLSLRTAESPIREWIARCDGWPRNYPELEAGPMAGCRPEPQAKDLTIFGKTQGPSSAAQDDNCPCQSLYNNLRTAINKLFFLHECDLSGQSDIP